MNVSKGIVISSTVDSNSWTTASPILSEEEDAILTIVIVIFGALVAIIILCSMGIFIDCLHQDNMPLKKKRLRIKVPPISRRENYNDDKKSLASNMCSSGINNFEANTTVVII